MGKDSGKESATKKGSGKDSGKKKEKGSKKASGKKEKKPSVKKAGATAAGGATAQPSSRAGMVPLEKVPKWKVTDIGCRVEVPDMGPGTLHFVGKHAESGKARLGIELDSPNGKHSGTVKGAVYFKAAKKHGALVATKGVTKIDGSAPVAAPPTNPFAGNNPFGGGGEDGNPFSGGDGNPFGAPAAAAVPADEYESLGRLKLVKLCRDKGLDFKAVAKDVEGLKALLRGGAAAAVPDADFNPFASATAPDSANPLTPFDSVPPAAAPPAAAPPAQDYSSMGRLALMKECREKNLDYKAVARDPDALRRLLRMADLESPAAAAAAA